jgi:hypothetical protein
MAEPSNPSYSGDSPYIFISYAHEDMDIVSREIDRLNTLGYRVWYDDGITPTKEFDLELEQRVKNCSMLIIFISKISISRYWVWKEISIAFKAHRTILPIYLDQNLQPDKITNDQIPVEFQEDLHRFQSIQGILKWKHDEFRYHQKIKEAIPDFLRHESNIKRSPQPHDTRDLPFKEKPLETGSPDYKRNLGFLLKPSPGEHIPGFLIPGLKDFVEKADDNYQNALKLSENSYQLYTVLQVCIGFSFILASIIILYEVIRQTGDFTIAIIVLMCVSVILLAIGVKKKYSSLWIVAEYKCQQYLTLGYSQFFVSGNNPAINQKIATIENSSDLHTIIDWTCGTISSEPDYSCHLNLPLQDLQGLVQYYKDKRVNPEIQTTYTTQNDIRLKSRILKYAKTGLIFILFSVILYYILLDLLSFVPGDNTVFVGIKWLIMGILLLIFYQIVEYIFRAWFGQEEELSILSFENSEKMLLLSRVVEDLNRVSEKIQELVKAGQGNEIGHRMNYGHEVCNIFGRTERAIQNYNRVRTAGILKRKGIL